MQPCVYPQPFDPAVSTVRSYSVYSTMRRRQRSLNETVPVEEKGSNLADTSGTVTTKKPWTIRMGVALAVVLLINLGSIASISSNQSMMNSSPQSQALANFLRPKANEASEVPRPGSASEEVIDIQAFVDNEIIQGKKHIVLPPGRHYVEPQHNEGRVHLLLEGLEDVVIDGMDQAEIICTKTTRAIDVVNCKNLTLKGFVVDYDPLPFTQGEIVDISDDKLELTVSMIDGYPEADTIDERIIEIYSSTTNELSTITYFDLTVEMIGETGKEVLVKKKVFYGDQSREQVGDIVVFESNNLEKMFPHAIVATECTNMVVENVKIYASNMFGILETDCSGSFYINSVVDRRLPEEDLKQRGYRRVRSTNADAFHSKHARIGPSYINITARYNGDDGIAVNGHFHLISKISEGPSNVIRVIGKNGQVPNLAEDEEVQLVKYSGERIENAKIVQFDPEQSLELEQVEKDFLIKQLFSGDVQKTKSASKVYVITLDRSIDLPMGSLIASVNRLGNGFNIKDCTIGPNRARGMLLKASNGTVTGNTVRDTWLPGIMLAPEYSWLEAGSGNDIVVTGNTIERAHGTAIGVYAYGGDGSVAPAGAHTGIVIGDNHIVDSSMPAIAATSTRDLVLFRNKIIVSDNSLVPYWNLRNFSRARDPQRQIYLENVENVIEM